MLFKYRNFVQRKIFLRVQWIFFLSFFLVKAVMVLPVKEQSRDITHSMVQQRQCCPPYELSRRRSWHPENRLKGLGQVHEDMLPEDRVWSVPRYCPLPFPPLSLHANTPSPTCAQARGLNTGALHCTQVPYSCTLYRLYWQLYTLHIVLTVVHCTHCTDSCTLYTWYWEL